MEALKHTYETMFIVSMQPGEEVVAETVSKFKNLIETNSEIIEVSEWGRRRLAYPINDLNEGYYVIVNFKSAADFPAELERLLGINENILRSLTIRQEYKKKAQIAPQTESVISSDASEAEISAETAEAEIPAEAEISAETANEAAE